MYDLNHEETNMYVMPLNNNGNSYELCVILYLIEATQDNTRNLTQLRIDQRLCAMIIIICILATKMSCIKIASLRATYKLLNHENCDGNLAITT